MNGQLRGNERTRLALGVSCLKVEDFDSLEMSFFCFTSIEFSCCLSIHLKLFAYLISNW